MFAFVYLYCIGWAVTNVVTICNTCQTEGNKICLKQTLSVRDASDVSLFVFSLLYGLNAA